MITADLKLVDESEEFTRGQTILVRDYVNDDWEKLLFLRYEKCDDYPYICGNDSLAIWTSWKYAKALSN
jgi:hypothetical protein